MLLPGTCCTWEIIFDLLIEPLPQKFSKVADAKGREISEEDQIC